MMYEISQRAPADVRAAIRAPVGAHLPFRGTRVVERAAEGWYQLVTPGSSSVGGNEVLFSSGDVDVAAVMAEYAGAGVARFKWCVWQGSEAMEGRLEASGFERWEARAMVVETAAVTVPAPATATAGVVVEEVTAVDARFEAYLATLAAGWETAAAEQAELERCLRGVLEERTGRPRRHRFYVAWCDGVAVGTGGFVVQEGLDAIYLTGGVVLPAYRGRGIYRALIAARVADAGGARFVVTHARSHTSAPILERMGFRTAATYRVFLSP
jgi:GNAT superfamily N-acetyltransferase